MRPLDPTPAVAATTWNERTPGPVGFSDTASADLRRRIINDIRALADFLDLNPDLPIGPHTRVEVVYFPHTDNDEDAFDEVADVASLLGRIPAWEGEHYVVEHTHGAGRYRAVAIPEHTRAAYRAWLTYTGHVHPA